MSSTKQDGIEVVNYMKEKKGNWRDKKPQVIHDKTCYRCGKPVLQGEKYVECVD